MSVVVVINILCIWNYVQLCQFVAVRLSVAVTSSPPHVYLHSMHTHVSVSNGGTAAALLPPFRPGNPALRGSRPLVTPYYCRL